MPCACAPNERSLIISWWWGASVLVLLLNVCGFGDGFRRFAVLWLRSSQHFALRGRPINGFVVYVCVYIFQFLLSCACFGSRNIDIIEIRSPPFFSSN